MNWYNIKNLSKTSTEVVIYDEIGPSRAHIQPHISSNTGLESARLGYIRLLSSNIYNNGKQSKWSSSAASSPGPAHAQTTLIDHIGDNPSIVVEVVEQSTIETQICYIVVSTASCYSGGLVNGCLCSSGLLGNQRLRQLVSPDGFAARSRD